MTALINADLVRLDADLGADKHETIRRLADVVAAAGRSTDVEQLLADALAREAKSATGLKGGIAIPHCRTAGVDVPTLAFARLAPPVDFGAKDGPAEIVFLIAAPEGGDDTHLTILTKLARALVRPEFTQALREASSADEVVALVTEVVPMPSRPPRLPGSGAIPPPSRVPLPLWPRLPPPGAASWRSPPARRASLTPTWPLRHSRPPLPPPASTSRSRPRGRRARTH